MSITLGVIGYGNMGKALALGVLRHKNAHATFPVLVYDAYAPARTAAQGQGFPLAGGIRDLGEKADIILLAVKPEQVPGVLAELSPALTSAKIIVSIAAGVNLQQLQAGCAGQCPVVRAMPNTFAAVGAGLFALCLDDPALTTEQAEQVQQLFTALGTSIVLSEGKMNAFTALAGCGPAYVFYFAEALVEAGVTMGLSRGSATSIALSLLQGGATLAEESKTHLSLLREQVTSPGGMTIAGTNTLDQRGVRGALVEAVLAAYHKGKEMEQTTT